MSTYLDKLGRVTGVQQSAARLHDVLGDAGGSLSKFLTRAEVGAAPDVGDGLGTVVGTAAGAYIGHKRGGHWLLGAIGGGSVGRNAPALLDPALRRTAVVNMGQTATAVALSLASPAHPVAGFVIGELVAGAAIYFWKLR